MMRNEDRGGVPLTFDEDDLDAEVTPPDVEEEPVFEEAIDVTDALLAGTPGIARHGLEYPRAPDDFETLPALQLIARARELKEDLHRARADLQDAEARLGRIAELESQLAFEQARVDQLRDQLNDAAQQAAEQNREYGLVCGRWNASRGREKKLKAELEVYHELDKRRVETGIEEGIERKIELRLEPGADEYETRKVAHLVIERDKAQAMKEAVTSAVRECDGIGCRQPIDVASNNPSGDGCVTLTVNRENGAWVRNFAVPLNYALRYLAVLGEVWVRHIEDRYVSKMGTALQRHGEEQ